MTATKRRKGFLYATAPDGTEVNRKTERPYKFVIFVRTYTEAYKERSKRWNGGKEPVEKNPGNYGMWGWSERKDSADKQVAQARKVYSDVIIVPVEGTNG